eukprot:1158800-Pelagomonas_calceolata.AAC.11
MMCQRHLQQITSSDAHEQQSTCVPLAMMAEGKKRQREAPTRTPKHTHNGLQTHTTTGTRPAQQQP